MNFKGLLSFMEDTGIIFINKEMKWPCGLTTFYCIYLDMKRLSNYNDVWTFFVILHEISHYKRITKLGKNHVLEMLSLEDFDGFCDFIIGEEIICDRYACLLHKHFNGYTFPRSATQQLDLEMYKVAYKTKAKQLFGVIKNDEENYKKLMAEFLS